MEGLRRSARARPRIALAVWHLDTAGADEGYEGVVPSQGRNDGKDSTGRATPN